MTQQSAIDGPSSHGGGACMYGGRENRKWRRAIDFVARFHDHIPSRYVLPVLTCLVERTHGVYSVTYNETTWCIRLGGRL